jgi:hypothetical protein
MLHMGPKNNNFINAMILKFGVSVSAIAELEP